MVVLRQHASMEILIHSPMLPQTLFWKANTFIVCQLHIIWGCWQGQGVLLFPTPLFLQREFFPLNLSPHCLGVQSDLKPGVFWKKTWQVYFLSSPLVFETYLPAKKSILADQVESLVVKVLNLLFIQGEQVKPFAQSQGLRIRKSIVATCSQRALFGSPSTSLFCPAHWIQNSGGENGSYLAVPSKPILSSTQSLPTICNIMHQRKLSLHKIFFYLEVASNRNLFYNFLKLRYGYSQDNFIVQGHQSTSPCDIFTIFISKWIWFKFS